MVCCVGSSNQFRFRFRLCSNSGLYSQPLFSPAFRVTNLCSDPFLFHLLLANSASVFYFFQFWLFLPPTLPFAFRTFIMSSEPFFQLPPLCFSSDMLPPLHFPSATLPTSRDPSYLKSRLPTSLPLPLSALHLSSATILPETYLIALLTSLPLPTRYPSTSVTLHFTFLFRTISNFSPACDYCPERPSRAWP